MKGGIIRPRGPGGTWGYYIDLGLQPAVRCEACSKRAWGARAPKRCKCGNTELRHTVERRQQFVQGLRTRAEAVAARAKAVAAFAQNDYVARDRESVAEFLEQEWLPSLKASGKVRASTLVAYTTHVTKHLVPSLGHVELQRLSTPQINTLYGNLGKPSDGRRALSAGTRRRIHATLHHALADAVRWHRLTRNPADAADLPRQPRQGERAMKTWTKEELAAFLDFVHNERLFALWRLLAMSGCRRGEALGATWQDIDLKAGRIAIRRARVQVGYAVEVADTKTGRSRLISLDGGTVAALKDYRSLREDECALRSVKLQEGDFVFCSEDGQPLHPDGVTSAFDRHQKSLRAHLVEEHKKLHPDDSEAPVFPRIRLHDLRHTHATLMLAAGVHPKVVSERLGHASISMTLDVYSHAIPALQESAAALVAALVDAVEAVEAA